MRRSLGLISALIIAFVYNPVGRACSSSQSHRDIRKELGTLVSLRLDHDTLASLFEIGDRRILDLIQALDDGDRRISLNAQVVIRYLGNDQGMRSLYEWYKQKQGEYQVAGPVPLPLSEWDYDYIKLNCTDKPVKAWRDREVQYIYALLLDGSTRARDILGQLIEKAKGSDDSSFVSRAIRFVTKGGPTRLLTTEKDLANAVLTSAFFIAPVDQRHTSARLLAFNADKNKVLVELHIDRGNLAEQWYHVVLIRQAQEWAFFSIYQVAIS